MFGVKIVQSFYSIPNSKWVTAQLLIMCVFLAPQHFVYCMAKATGAAPEHRMNWQAVRFHKWDLGAICWHCQTEQKLNKYVVRECIIIEVR